MMSKTEHQPMDPNAPESKTPIASINRARTCYAAQTLNFEVQEAFPETGVEVSNVNRYNVALDIAFDCSNEPDLAWLLQQLEDRRIKEIIEDEGQVLVSFHDSFRTQDSRDPFGLTDAALLLDEGEPS